MKHLFNMKMEEGGFVANHLNEFNIITSQLSSMGINFIWGIMNLVRLLERAMLRLSCRMGIIGYYMR